MTIDYNVKIFLFPFPFNFISGNLRSSESAKRIPDPNPSLNWGDLDVFLYQPHEREGFGSGIRFADSDQQYPPGTQEKNNSFLSRDLMMGKSKELELPEGPGGLESASRILMKGSGIRFTDSDDRGFPLILMTLAKQKVP